MAKYRDGQIEDYRLMSCPWRAFLWATFFRVLRRLRKNGIRGYKLKYKLWKFKHAFYDYKKMEYIIPKRNTINAVLQGKLVPITPQQKGALLLHYPQKLFEPIIKRFKYNRFLNLRRTVIKEQFWKKSADFGPSIGAYDCGLVLLFGFYHPFLWLFIGLWRFNFKRIYRPTYEKRIFTTINPLLQWRLGRPKRELIMQKSIVWLMIFWIWKFVFECFIAMFRAFRKHQQKDFERWQDKQESKMENELQMNYDDDNSVDTEKEDEPPAEVPRWDED